MGARRWVLTLACGLTFAAALTAPAEADPRWRRGHYYGPPVYVVPPPPVYVAPRPYYHAPRPVYVAPAPVYVPPPPVYVAPPAYYAPVPRPGVGIYFGF